MDPVELDPAEPSGEPAAPRERRRFWRTFLISLAVCEGLGWILDALPARTGEPFCLRWLRALAEHPLRGPLGLSLAWIGLIQAARAVFNRSRA